ncbi:MAG TPA: lysophospholipid acyltransferase family protein [Pusillimonas sp.]|jgi:KDO2-lipid IV(A) lauroyltransferase|nr:lysophospholipid acyltransferase family protein [Pusillimonas sp.]|tara:strand:+ start:199400 stop:200269 length:870 start_codon:yes stop_codon:yes gene_type:complete
MMKYKIRPYLASLLFAGVAALPLILVQRIGKVCGWVLSVVPGRYKRRAQTNLEHAFPHLPPIALKQSMIAVGQLFLEMPYWWVRRDDQALNKQVYCDDWKPFEKALSRGKGVILLSPHCGCFELLGPVYSSHFPSTVLFRPPRKAWLQDWIVKMRTRKQLTMAPANKSGVRTVVKTLLRGHTVGILPDQVPVSGEGVWAPFFGKPAYTMTLVQRLQSLTGATIFILGAERNRIGQGYKMHVKEMTSPLPDNPVEAATVINAEMEGVIRMMPTQYLWGYNRYRQPRTKPS